MTYPCTVRINHRAQREYIVKVLSRPDVLVAASKFILMLASTRIWSSQGQLIYRIRRLTVGSGDVYVARLPTRPVVMIMFVADDPLAAKICSIGSRRELFGRGVAD